MEFENPAPRIFLLSPASAAGARAAQIMAPRAQFETALRYRSPEGVPVAEAFAFMSSLYFRGKITYARRFAAPPFRLAETGSAGIFVIVPGFGLVAPDWRLTRDRMKTLRGTPVDPASRAYRVPLSEDALRLREQLDGGSRVILLGSIATGKYVDVVQPVFGDRLVFPRLFVGTGDMRRGSLLLRAAAAGEELEYATLDIPRRTTRAGLKD